MANRFYSAVVGEHVAALVTEGAASSGEAIELRVADSVYSDKLAVLHALEAIKQYLMTKEGNPIS